LQNRLIQTSQTGGQWYSDTSPFSIPWTDTPAFFSGFKDEEKSFITLTAEEQRSTSHPQNSRSSPRQVT
jgi:hypothetical protein